MKYLLYARRFHLGVSDTAYRCTSSSVEELLAALTTPDPSTFAAVSPPSIETFSCASCQMSILKFIKSHLWNPCILQIHLVALQMPYLSKEILISACFFEYTGVSCGIWNLKAMHHGYLLLTITAESYLKQRWCHNNKGQISADSCPCFHKH